MNTILTSSSIPSIQIKRKPTEWPTGSDQRFAARSWITWSLFKTMEEGNDYFNTTEIIQNFSFERWGWMVRAQEMIKVSLILPAARKHWAMAWGAFCPVEFDIKPTIKPFRIFSLPYLAHLCEYLDKLQIALYPNWLWVYEHFWLCCA